MKVRIGIATYPGYDSILVYVSEQTIKYFRKQDAPKLQLGTYDVTIKRSSKGKYKVKKLKNGKVFISWNKKRGYELCYPGALAFFGIKGYTKMPYKLTTFDIKFERILYSHTV